MTVAFGTMTAVLLAVQAAWAWRGGREEPAQRLVAPWGALLALVTLGEATAPSGPWLAAMAVASVSVISLGLLGVCLRVFAGRSGWPAWIAAAAALGLAHPALAPELRASALLAVGAAGAAGSWVCIGGALRRAAEPRLAHLSTMFFAAAAVVRLAVPAGTPSGYVPLLLAGVASVGAHAWWVRQTAPRTLEEVNGDAAADDDALDVRGDDRVGDVVDVAEALRRRASRAAGRRGGVGET